MGIGPSWSMFIRAFIFCSRDHIADPSQHIKAMSSPCFISFIEQFLRDLGVPEGQIPPIVAGFNRIIEAYDAALPTQSLTDIVSNLLTCVKNRFSGAIEQTSSVIFSAIAAVCVVTFIIIVIIAVALVYGTPAEIFTAIVVAVIIYLIALYLIVTSARESVDTIRNNAVSGITGCISKASSDLITYETQQKDAISKAFCSYSPPQ